MEQFEQYPVGIEQPDCECCETCAPVWWGDAWVCAHGGPFHGYQDADGLPLAYPERS